MVRERIGLKQGAFGFSLFEVFGLLERNMLPQEKVADAMFKWEKYARSTNSQKTLKLTFKVRPAAATCSQVPLQWCSTDPFFLLPSAPPPTRNDSLSSPS